MGCARARAENLIDARPAAVYAVLADYTTHHPRIMPASLFSNLEVETGGVGAGTVFHINLRMLGRLQRLHMEVAEPVPGRVLTETNIDTGVVTEFTVTSAADQSCTLARILSEWETDGGVRGMIDRLVTSRLMKWVFAQLLRELGHYMISRESPDQANPQGQRKGER